MWYVLERDTQAGSLIKEILWLICCNALMNIESFSPAMWWSVDFGNIENIGTV